ncbi:hypothetical protein GUITHDRAFT_120169 [Guillardia theta CCMP2712]|uniref:Uncharacterized protein n=1 Tax=Guillardia theta (strain CCMP2712) TaxID=905079 RepID=L1IC13_GUITC|nr:hypothetical protein GUITHDRAFT_120169 [Guillardia theta CCMP2712]EKX33642.1 hypothetical protein GUITHDRAFT_120169 [Guillardia theta CCMP2712]|eukprot:XP_005820622.1 hypothetical protein GUITHDRAFT_120169 [Guillardia theta CCMP2712]
MDDLESDLKPRLIALQQCLSTVASALHDFQSGRAYVDSLGGSVNSSVVRFGVKAGDKDESCDAILTKMEFQMKDLMDLAYKIRHGFVRFPRETATL